MDRITLEPLRWMDESARISILTIDGLSQELFSDHRLERHRVFMCGETGRRASPYPDHAFRVSPSGFSHGTGPFVPTCSRRLSR